MPNYLSIKVCEAEARHKRKEKTCSYGDLHSIGVWLKIKSSFPQLPVSRKEVHMLPIRYQPLIQALHYRIPWTYKGDKPGLTLLQGSPAPGPWSVGNRTMQVAGKHASLQSCICTSGTHTKPSLLSLCGLQSQKGWGQLLYFNPSSLSGWSIIC